MTRRFSSSPSSASRTTGGRSSMNPRRRFSTRPCFSSSLTASSPIAGADDSPGEQMPARFIIRRQERLTPITKSDSEVVGLTPVYSLMIFLKLTDGTDERPDFIILSSDSRSVERSSASARGSASGPTSRLPWTVGATSTPLKPFSSGQRKMTELTFFPSSLSST